MKGDITYEFVKKSVEDRGYLLISTEYVRSDKKLDMWCKIHGVFQLRWMDFNYGRGCKYCSGDARFLNADEVKKHVEDYGFFVIVGYVGAREKIVFRCKHGHVTKIIYSSFRLRPYCSECKRRERKASRVNSVKKYILSCGYSTIDGKYRTAHEKIPIVCPRGHRSEISYNNFRKGRRCNECRNENLSKNRRKSLDDVVSILDDNGYRYISGEYINRHSKLKVSCENGHVSKKTLASIQTKGNSCVRCIESSGERAVRLFLEEHDISYEKEKRFKNCRDKKPLIFDFYIQDRNLCIEYNGRQHYRPVKFGGTSKESASANFESQKKRDSIKRDCCKKFGLQLLEIPYWEKENINNILTDRLLNGDR